MVESEAHIVCLIFAWIGLDRMSLRAVCRAYNRWAAKRGKGQRIGMPPRSAACWIIRPISDAQPSGEDNSYPLGRGTWPIRGHLKPSPRATSRVPVSREESIESPVPSIVDPVVFEAVRAQLEENRRRKRERQRGQPWLLQGLTVCRRCGYAYYRK